MAFSTLTSRVNDMYRDVCTLKEVASVVYPKKGYPAPTERKLESVVRAALTQYPAFGSLIKAIVEMHPVSRAEMYEAAPNNSTTPSCGSNHKGLLANQPGTTIATAMTASHAPTAHEIAGNLDVEMDLGDFTLSELEFTDDPAYIPRAPSSLSHSPPCTDQPQSPRDERVSFDLDVNDHLVLAQDLSDIELPDMLVLHEWESIALPPSGQREQTVKPWATFISPPTTPSEPTRQAGSVPRKSILKRSRCVAGLTPCEYTAKPVYCSKGSKDAPHAHLDWLSTWFLPIIGLVLLVAGPTACFFAVGWLYLAFPGSTHSALTGITSAQKTVRFKLDLETQTPVISNTAHSDRVESSGPLVMLAPANNGSEREDIVYYGPTIAPASLMGQSQPLNGAGRRKRSNALGRDSQADIQAVISSFTPLAPPCSPCLPLATGPAPISAKPPTSLPNTNSSSRRHHGRQGSNMGEWLQQLASSQTLGVEVPSMEREKLARMLHTPPSSPDSTPPSTPTLPFTPFSSVLTQGKPYLVMAAAMSRLGGSRSSV